MSLPQPKPFDDREWDDIVRRHHQRVVVSVLAMVEVESDVPHAVRLDLPGYVDVNTDVLVRGAQTLTLRQALQPVAAPPH